MNILLVQPSYNDPGHYTSVPSRALLILGTLAKQKGHNVRIMHVDMDGQVTAEVLKEFKPDILGITVNTFQCRNAKEIANMVKAQGNGTMLVVGGPHAVVWEGPADKVVIGEGENQWLEILGEPANINTPDDVPIPDYSLVDLSRFYGVKPVGAIPSTEIMVSRGCPFSCIFCNTPIFWGNKVRYRSPQLVVEELVHLHKRWGIAEVFLQDDTFNANIPWAMEIFERIIKKGLNKTMLFKICCRVNHKMLTKELLDMAYRAGVWNIFFGVESGCQSQLDRMHKGQTVEDIVRAIEMTHDAHICQQCSLIVGTPGETWDTLIETRDLMRKAQPRVLGWAHACPFPHTEMDRIVTERGHKRLIPYEEYGYGQVICRTEALDYSDLEKFQGF